MIKPNQLSYFVVVVIVALVYGGQKSAEAQTRFIELEISQSRMADLTTQHKWMEMLSEVGADRIRSKAAEVPGRPSVDEVKSASSTTVLIKGHVNRNRLILPGGSFAMSDKESIKAYIKRLRDDGAEVAMAEKKAFGLTGPQLVAVHEDLSSTVNFSTKDQHVGESVLKMITDIKTPVVLSAAARTALTREDTIQEELQGLSVGTALAAAIRPLGLVMQPHREQGKSVEIRIEDTRDAEENWPVGWPIDQPLNRVAPKLFTRTDVQIKGFPLKTALDAIERRCDVPFLYDHNSLARRDLDPTEIRVTFERKKTTYMTAIKHILSQSKPRMFKELRVDENGKAFLWVTTSR